MKHIATPIQSQGTLGSGRDAMILLKHKILKSILLRRTKKGRSADLALPPKLVSTILSYAASHQDLHINLSMSCNLFFVRCHYDGIHWILKKKITTPHCTMKVGHNLTRESTNSFSLWFKIVSCVVYFVYDLFVSFLKFYPTASKYFGICKWYHCLNLCSKWWLMMPRIT